MGFIQMNSHQSKTLKGCFLWEFMTEKLHASTPNMVFGGTDTKPSEMRWNTSESSVNNAK